MSLAGLAGLPAGLMQGQQFAQQQQLAMLRMQAEIARRRQQQEQEQAVGLGFRAAQQQPMAPQPTGGQVAGAQDLLTAATHPAPSGGPPMAPNLAGRNVNWQGETPEFQRRVGAMLESEPPNIRAASAVDSAYRSPQEQAEIYARSGQGTKFAAAAPGKSMHNRGEAADWTFKTPEADQAIHRDAGRFGLSFPFVGGGAGAGGKLSDPNHMQLAASLGLSPEEHGQSQQLAQGIGSQIPPQFAGQVDIGGLARMIERTAGPGVPDHVKAMALGYLAPLMNQNSQTQFKDMMEVLKYQQTARGHDIQIRGQDIQASERDATRAQTRELAEERLAQGQQRIEQGDKRIDLQQKKTGVTDTQAEWVANYIQATGVWPVGSGRNQALQNRVEQILGEKGVDPTKIAQAQGTFKADQTSLSAATKLADAAASYEQTAQKNLQIATEQLHKAAPTDWGPAINKWIETGETFAGNPNVPPSVAAVVTLANEYAKVMSGATGAQAATDSSRREAAEILNPYFSSGQWDAVTQKVIIPDMNNRITSLYDQVDIIKSRIGRGGGGATPRPTPAQPGVAYNSADDIYKAIDSGALTPEQGKKMLIDKFGFKPTPAQ